MFWTIRFINIYLYSFNHIYILGLKYNVCYKTSFNHCVNMSVSKIDKLRHSYKIFNHFSKLEKRVFKANLFGGDNDIISEFLV